MSQSSLTILRGVARSDSEQSSAIQSIQHTMHGLGISTEGKWTWKQEVQLLSKETPRMSENLHRHKMHGSRGSLVAAGPYAAA